MATTIKQALCGATVIGLLAGTGAPVAHGVPSALHSADWALAAEHVLLIGTDGTNLSKILEHAYDSTSGFKTLMDQGITGATTLVDHTTISGPSWSTILTGVWDTKHGVINNIFSPEPYAAWPTVFDLLKAHDPNIDTSVIADWDFITDIGKSGVFPADHATLVTSADDDWATTSHQVALDTIARIQELQATPNLDSFIFSYQVEVDEAGHGFGGGSEEYAQAVVNVGHNIQQILAAVDAYEQATGEKWTVIVTTDHGHQQSQSFIGHGFQTPNETSQFIIVDHADGTDHGAQNLGYSAVDITPTILALFGAPMRSDFDGAPMFTDPTILNGIVEPADLKQALFDAIDSFGYPNIGNDITLALRTIIGSIPYGLYLGLQTVDEFLQGIIDQDIPLLSDLASGTKDVVDFLFQPLIDGTQDVALFLSHLLGAGSIAPTDPPLTLPGGAESLPIDGFGLGGDDSYADSLVPELEALSA